MQEFKRTDRVASQLQRELAALVRDELKDPRLGMITIQEVRVARDYSHAKVYFTALGGEADSKECEEILNGPARRYLRRLLGQRIRLRTIPELHFVYDVSIDKGEHLSELIEKAVAADKHHPSESE
ncbi:MAG TPA: 30S ribosome-binding factor RbfA [Chromatiales bacterium]|nr:30S ribosome-binding factor RbfA [Chromatiales bacterium]